MKEQLPLREKCPHEIFPHRQLQSSRTQDSNNHGEVHLTTTHCAPQKVE